MISLILALLHFAVGSSEVLILKLVFEMFSEFYLAVITNEEADFKSVIFYVDFVVSISTF